MEILTTFENVIWVLLTALYTYQLFYFVYMLAVRLFRRDKKEIPDSGELHKFGIIIPARNEEAMIENLIRSIHGQNYPQELIKIFVIADNCTDNTAGVAEACGAEVFVRNNQEQVGKGYALDYLFHILLGRGDDCDAYLIFDADNIIDKKFIPEMNKVYNRGYRIATSYRNSKNYGTNWISAGSSLWFLRESRYLNEARMRLGTSCAISGTGFMLGHEIVEKNNGWKYFTLTEDIEFSVCSAIDGERIGYSAGSVLYDEQPVEFSQSWKQRARWAKGFFQIIKKYGWKLFVNAFIKLRFGCFDMLMTVFPAVFLTVFSIVVNTMKAVVFIAENKHLTTIDVIANPTVLFFCGLYILLFSAGFVTTLTEWKNIRCSAGKKLLYTLTFPIYMLTYIPIGIYAFFRKVQWTPIKHTVTTKIEDM